MKNKSEIIPIISNSIIVILEIIGLIISVVLWGFGMFKFYTQDSNFFALIACIIYIVYLIRKITTKKDIPQWVIDIRYMATCCLTLTFLVVIFVLIPLSGWENAASMLFNDSMLYHHFLCPVIAIISFVFLEGEGKIEKNKIVIAMLPTIVYAIVTVILNVLRILHGPYPFLYVYQQPIWMSCLWVVIILGMAFLIAWSLYFVRKKLVKKS